MPRSLLFLTDCNEGAALICSLLITSMTGSMTYAALQHLSCRSCEEVLRRQQLQVQKVAGSRDLIVGTESTEGSVRM